MQSCKTHEWPDNIFEKLYSDTHLNVKFKLSCTVLKQVVRIRTYIKLQPSECSFPYAIIIM